MCELRLKAQPQQEPVRPELRAERRPEPLRCETDTTTPLSWASESWKK